MIGMLGKMNLELFHNISMVVTVILTGVGLNLSFWEILDYI